MQITHGLLPGQVLQRNLHNLGAAVASGPASVQGEVEFQCAGSGAGAWQAAGRADGTAFRAHLTGIPVGGPYTFRLRIREGRTVKAKTSVKNIYCGDVWFMGGQSNMQGCGNMVNAPQPHPKVRAFYMRDAWAIAKEPLTFMAEAVDVFHNGYGEDPARRPPQEQLDLVRRKSLKGVSPGLFFGLDMYRRTGVPQGLVACAHGGTSMAQWSPALRAQGGASLYGAMMRRFEKLGQPIRGILWYQGESDANDEAVKGYTGRMMDLVAATRRDMHLPRLPWLIVQLGRHIARDKGEWNGIQEQQRLLPQHIRNLEVAPAIDLDLDDSIHIAGTGHALLGCRLARLADHLALRNKQVKGGITFKRATVALKPPFPGEPTVPLLTLEYNNVVGSLQSAGRPEGFALLYNNGDPVDAIYKTRLAGKRVFIESQLSMEALRTVTLSYGHGRYPYCNITDSEGMSLPVMARIPLADRDGGMPFVLSWKAGLIRRTGTLDGITHKAALAATEWTPAHIEQGFMALPRPLTENRNGLFTFQTTVTAAAACEVILLFGADSPFVLWVNGREVMRDVNAFNPCIPAEYKQKVALKKGVQAITVGFDTRNSLGWGICLSFKAIRKRDSLAKLLAYC